jgi:hypothetical protein
MTSQHMTSQRAAITIIPIREAAGSFQEPALDDMLSDPIVMAMMDADGVDRRELRLMLGTVALALRGRGPLESGDWMSRAGGGQVEPHFAICL